MDSIKFNSVYIKDFYSIVGPLEKNSRLKNFDLAMDDYYYLEKTFEQAEVKMQKVVIDNLLYQNNILDKEIDLLIGGDLSNQISISSYAAQNYRMPFLGVYAACATFPEELFIAANFIDNNIIKNALIVTSAHNLNAEKQFRYPIEYGAPKPHTATFTATGAISCIVTKDVQSIKVESATLGEVTNLGVKDANHMGAVMAPAAAATIYKHLTDLKRNIDYYDLVLTGDLGCVGANILREYLKKTHNIKLKNHIDAGCELFLKSQDTYAGGSGPACLPLIFFNKIVKEKKHAKVLIVGTGSLHSVAFVNQQLNIPAVAHAISLEVAI